MSTGRPTDSEYELFQEDLDRLAPHIETAIARVPAFGEVGVKKVYNGAIAYTPDGSPIVGPAWGVQNFWLNEGHSFGVTAAGGAGWQLAEWIVEGEPTIDMLGVDPRRFGPYADARLSQARRTRRPTPTSSPSHYPDEERAAARPLKRDALLRPHEGARRGVRLGLWLGAAELVRAARLRLVGGAISTKPDVLLNENHAPADRRRQDRARNGASAAPTISPSSATRCRNVHDNVGLQDMSAFAKCDRLRARAREAGSIRSSPTASRRSVGRIALCHLLSQNGGVRAEFTVYRTGAGALLSRLGRRAASAHDYDIAAKAPARRRQRALRPGHHRNAACWCSPARARARCCRSSPTPTSPTPRSPGSPGKPIIGRRRPALHALRVNFVGELGCELHHPIEMQNAIFDLLMAAGAAVRASSRSASAR